jgi:hypothetical protein
MTKTTIVPAHPGWFAARAGEPSKRVPLDKQPVVAWAIWHDPNSSYRAQPITTRADHNECWGYGFSDFLVDPYGRFHSEDEPSAVFDTEADANAWVAEKDKSHRVHQIVEAMKKGGLITLQAAVSAPPEGSVRLPVVWHLRRSSREAQ